MRRFVNMQRLRRGARALTLVEVIGVLAIMAIIASFVAPSLIRQVQTATAAGEDAKLEDIAQALTNAIRATGLIPNPNLDPATTNPAGGYGWAYLASNYTRLAGSNLLSVFPGVTNDTRRRLYLSTNLAGTAAGLYASSISNWGPVFFPTNAKMYLVSASRPDFPLALPGNGPGAQTNDNGFASNVVASLETWNKVVVDGTVAAPANLVDGWTNKGEFLHVRTLDLAPIFSEVRAAQQKAIEQEDKNLEEIARALLASIQATGVIPDPGVTASAGWVSQVSRYSSLGSLAIQYPFPASLIGTSERRFYLDANLLLYTNGVPAAGWTNLPDGPASAYLVSSSREDSAVLETSTANGGTALNPAALSFLRTWQKAPSSGGIYAATNTDIVTAAWTNRGEFLHVKSIDLRPLFCRVELEDLRSPGSVLITDNGSGYSSPIITINTNGVTVSINCAGTNSTNMVLNSASIVSPPGKNLWINTGDTNQPQPIPISISAGGGSGGEIVLRFPDAPSFSVGTALPTMMTNQTEIFYILKGKQLNLSGNPAVIQQDSKFQFSNGAWKQSY